MRNHRRFRLRFEKTGDMRWIGHRDLVRTLEKSLRRSGLEMAMTQGFHPRPKFSFPLALPLGVDGHEEVMELQLSSSVDELELLEKIAGCLPSGLQVFRAEPLAEIDPKSRVQSITYAIAVPEDLWPKSQRAIAVLLNETSWVVQREGKPNGVDIRPLIEDLSLDGGRLQMRLLVTPQLAVRPREVLRALGLDNLESCGYVLARSHVELEP